MFILLKDCEKRATERLQTELNITNIKMYLMGQWPTAGNYFQ